ncbi:WD repeat-containing protein WRAP73 [Dufourea novaeangliae]|uniref:WD repeat-containing protein WRAP73 n=1 Tax=Dufourea novaeangliae TaxID=178035 RepID=A0A154P233_DUFNO|nr:WD repeat-containing protein WRAP73 [Dufourea novaeangliae]
MDGRFFAFAYQENLITKNSKTFETIHSFVFPDIIEYLEWSRNSEYILCANIKKAIIEVYSIHYPECQFKLVEGSTGLESVTWSLDSKHILTLSDFNIQTSIWPLESQNVIHIQNVKSCYHKLHFSPNGKKLALIIANEGEDAIEIYKTDTWKLYKVSIQNLLLQIS